MNGFAQILSVPRRALLEEHDLPRVVAQACEVAVVGEVEDLAARTLLLVPAQVNHGTKL